MMTALPPAATTSSAVWRPIPLLPPRTTSFCPANTGIAIGRSGPSAWCRPSSQFMLIETFPSARCAGGKPAACLSASLADGTRPHIGAATRSVERNMGETTQDQSVMTSCNRGPADLGELPARERDVVLAAADGADTRAIAE